MYVCHPCDIPSEIKFHFFHKLQKAFYGLRQILLQRLRNLSGVLPGLKIRQLGTDCAFFTKAVSVNYLMKTIVVLEYVVYLKIVSGCKQMVMENIELLRPVFNGNDYGAQKIFFRIHMTRDSDERVFSQTSYVFHMVSELKLVNMKTISKPILKNCMMNSITLDKPNKNSTYQRGIGSLLYDFTPTRPYIATAVNILSKWLEKPKNCLKVQIVPFHI